MENSLQLVDETPKDDQHLVFNPSCVRWFDFYPDELPEPERMELRFSPYWCRPVDPDGEWDAGGGAVFTVEMPNGASFIWENLDPMGEEIDSRSQGDWEEYAQLVGDDACDDGIPEAMWDLAKALVPRDLFFHDPQEDEDSD